MKRDGARARRGRETSARARRRRRRPRAARARARARGRGPVQDLRLGEELAALARGLDLAAEVAAVAVLHDDAERVLVLAEERVVVADDVRMVQPPQELDLRARRHPPHRPRRNRARGVTRGLPRARARANIGSGAHLRAAGLALPSSDIFDLDDLDAHERALRALPHQVDLAERALSENAYRLILPSMAGPPTTGPTSRPALWLPTRGANNRVGLIPGISADRPQNRSGPREGTDVPS